MKKIENDTVYYLEKAPVPKAIAHMAIPMVLGMVVNVIYSIIDAFFIGRLNNTAMLAAVTLAMPFMAIQMGIGQIFGVGGSTYISRLLGEKDEQGAKRASSVNFYLSLLSGLAVTLAGLPLMNPLLRALGAAGETLLYTRNFMLATIIGSPFIVAATALSETVRAEGAATQSMTGMVVSVAVNIILDPVFIFALKMNVTGAALATDIGNLCAVAYYVWRLKFKSTVQSVSPGDFRPSREILSSIFRVGSSAFLMCGFMVVSFLIFNNFAMRYGDNVVAAFGVANRVVQVCEFVGMGLYMGVVPLLAFAYSSGDRKRLRQVLQATALCLAGITAGIAAPIFLFRQQILALFSADASFIVVGVRVLTAMLVSTMFSAFGGFFTSMFQAFGKGAQSNIMSVIKGGGALIPIIIMGNMLLGMNGVIWSLTASELVACATGLALWAASKKKLIAAAPAALPDPA